MANSSSSDESWVAIIGALLFLILAFSWLTIPGSNGVNGFQVASLSFANGVFVGWADNIAALIMGGSSQEQSRILSDFRQAILTGESHYPVVVLIFVIIGTFLSVGGVIAVWMARSASSSGEAFKLGFFAEIAEGVVYNVGYYATTGKNGVSPEEIGLTLVAALIMGMIAIGVNSGARKTA